MEEHITKKRSSNTKKLGTSGSMSLRLVYVRDKAFTFPLTIRHCSTRYFIAMYEILSPPFLNTHTHIHTHAHNIRNYCLEINFDAVFSNIFRKLDNIVCLQVIKMYNTYILYL